MREAIKGAANKTQHKKMMVITGLTISALTIVPQACKADRKTVEIFLLKSINQNAGYIFYKKWPKRHRSKQPTGLSALQKIWRPAEQPGSKQKVNAQKTKPPGLLAEGHYIHSAVCRAALQAHATLWFGLRLGRRGFGRGLARRCV